MELLFNVIFAWTSVVLAVLLTIIWILRIGLKKGWFTSKSFFGRMSRSLRIYHKTVGIAFCVTALIHGFYSSMKVLSINYGTACFVAGLLLGAMYIVKKRVHRKIWLNVHRVLTICLFVLLAMHLIDVGGAPATSALLSGIGKEKAQIEEVVPDEEQSENEVETPQEEASQDEMEMPQTETSVVYEDGVYTGVAMGFGPNLTVEVTIENGEIMDIQIVSHNEKGQNFYEPAFVAVPQDIVDNQSIEVDSVSGSTYSSEGIKSAVAAALEQALIVKDIPKEEAEAPKVEEEASREEVAERSQTETSVVYEDGVYTGVAMGFGPDLTVEVTIENGEIMDIQIVSHNERNNSYYGPAFDVIPQYIVDSQSIEVDSVSGSTYSSVGIKNAVLDALEEAVVSGELPEEESLPKGKGHGH